MQRFVYNVKQEYPGGGTCEFSQAKYMNDVKSQFKSITDRSLR